MLQRGTSAANPCGLSNKEWKEEVSKLVSGTDMVWEDCQDGADDADIRFVEEQFGIIFPIDFVECVKKCNGGNPKRSDFKYVDPDWGPRVSCVGALLSFDLGRRYNILESCKLLSGQLPENIIPFAEDGGGNYICFDYREKPDSNSPKVVYWHHEKQLEKSITYLSESFTDFLARLFEPDE
jgi:cell wall assembly regulator SMI1